MFILSWLLPVLLALLVFLVPVFHDEKGGKGNWVRESVCVSEICIEVGKYICILCLCTLHTII